MNSRKLIQIVTMRHNKAKYFYWLSWRSEIINGSLIKQNVCLKMLKMLRSH